MKTVCLRVQDWDTAVRAIVPEKNDGCTVQPVLQNTQTVSWRIQGAARNFSDHIAMEESIREKFFDAIEETIIRHGGVIPLFDTIDLQLAGKP